MSYNKCVLCNKKKLFFVELHTKMRNIPMVTLMRGVRICIDCLRDPKVDVQQAFIKLGRVDMEKQKKDHQDAVGELDKLLNKLGGK